MIKRYKKPTVQLTSLLDLLFCMIFVSLLQSKTPVVKESPKADLPKEEVQTPAPVKPDPTTLVNAVFHFYKTSLNPSLPTGTYAMAGTYNSDTRELRLGGVSWINRPSGYDMVPLKGTISEDGFQFVGRIEFIDCQTFILKRTSKITGSPIAGKWEGTYTCLQGETGLTLTLQ
jgi:hypothetical protein